MESIGDFAEKLILNNIEESKDSPSTRSQLLSTATPEPNQLDISRVEVPDNFMEQILNEEVITEKKKVNPWAICKAKQNESPGMTDDSVERCIKQVKAEHPIKESEEKDLGILVAKFNALLIEAKQILGQLREVTTVGMGMGMPSAGASVSPTFRRKKRRKR